MVQDGDVVVQSLCDLRDSVNGRASSQSEGRRAESDLFGTAQTIINLALLHVRSASDNTPVATQAGVRCCSPPNNTRLVATLAHVTCSGDTGLQGLSPHRLASSNFNKSETVGIYASSGYATGNCLLKSQHISETSILDPDKIEPKSIIKTIVVKSTSQLHTRSVSNDAAGLLSSTGGVVVNKDAIHVNSNNGCFNDHCKENISNRPPTIEKSNSVNSCTNVGVFIVPEVPKLAKLPRVREQAVVTRARSAHAAAAAAAQTKLNDSLKCATTKNKIKFTANLNEKAKLSFILKVKIVKKTEVNLEAVDVMNNAVKSVDLEKNINSVEMVNEIDKSVDLDKDINSVEIINEIDRSADLKDINSVEIVNDSNKSVDVGNEISSSQEMGAYHGRSVSNVEPSLNGIVTRGAAKDKCNAVLPVVEHADPIKKDTISPSNQLFTKPQITHSFSAFQENQVSSNQNPKLIRNCETFLSTAVDILPDEERSKSSNTISPKLEKFQPCSLTSISSLSSIEESRVSSKSHLDTVWVSLYSLVRHPVLERTQSMRFPFILKKNYKSFVYFTFQ